MSFTITLSDVLVLTSVVCLIFFTVYLVLTLKSLIRLFEQSTVLVTETSKVVEDVSEKTKAVETYVSDLVSNGSGIFKAFSLVNKFRK
ncbi:MAG: hypothetical protein ACRCST_12985 [Turicibacter sp.]